MSRKASEYFDHLDAGAPINLKQPWEDEIRRAEETRMDDRSAMDIMRTREIASTQEMPVPISEGCDIPVQTWIQFAIDVEEQQCVNYPST